MGKGIKEKQNGKISATNPQRARAGATPLAVFAFHNQTNYVS